MVSVACASLDCIASTALRVYPHSIVTRAVSRLSYEDGESLRSFVCRARACEW